MTRTIHDRVTYGDALLSRFSALTLSASLKADLAAFKASHTLFVGAAAAVDAAENAYGAAAKKVAVRDVARDKTVPEIADKLPGAGLSKRTSPFAPFSKYSPTKLRDLPYAAETVELRSLAAKILAAKPPADITKLCARLTKENDDVANAVKALTAPLAALNQARTKRDAAIPEWERRLHRLEDASKVAFRDEEGRFEALFAEADAVQTRVRPKRRRVKAEALPSTRRDNAS